MPSLLCRVLRCVTKVSPLQERIVAGAGSNLSRLGKELTHVAIQGQFPDVLDGDEVFWPDLGRVEDVKVELMFL